MVITQDLWLIYFQSPAIPLLATNGHAPSPIPGRMGTPNRTTNGNDATSRATSQHPDTATTIPSEAPPHGAAARQYLNSTVAGVLLDGMKQLAKEQYVNTLRLQVFTFVNILADLKNLYEFWENTFCKNQRSWKAISVHDYYNGMAGSYLREWKVLAYLEVNGIKICDEQYLNKCGFQECVF